MNGFQHVLLSTLLVLVVYLVFQNQQLYVSTTALSTQQQGAADALAKTLAPLATQLTTINAAVSQSGKEADDAANQKLIPLQKRLELYAILGTLQQADGLRAAGKGAAAAEKLGSIKKPLWQAGEALAPQKNRLQALMGPIDKLAAGWKAGDTKTAADAVRKELEAVLEALGNG